MSTISENYSWVDARLEELYHGYALTKDNWEEFYDAGLLTENWAWVDAALEKQYYNTEFLPCPAPFNWVDYRNNNQFEIEERRPRAESDISDYSNAVEWIISQSDITANKNEQYNYCMATADDYESVISSLDLNSELYIAYDSDSNSNSDSNYDSDYEITNTYGWH